MKKNSRFSAANLFGPNYRRILFASCEMGGVSSTEPVPARSKRPVIQLSVKAVDRVGFTTAERSRMERGVKPVERVHEYVPAYSGADSED